MTFLLKGNLKLLKRSKRPLVILAIIHIFCILLYHSLTEKEGKSLETKYISGSGRVFDQKTLSGDFGVRYLLKVKTVEKPYDKLILRLDSEGLLSAERKNFRREDLIFVGKKISFEGKFEAFQSNKNDGGFDVKAYYENEGFQGSVRVKKLKFHPLAGSEKLLNFQTALFRIKRRILSNYRNILGDTEAGTLSAMLLGNKDLLDEEVRELYSDNAISHLLAISGLHISLIGLALFLLFKKMQFSYNLSAFLPIPFLIFYGFFTGFSVSTLRAVIMMVIFFFSYLLRRAYDIPSALALSGILLLLFNPRQLYQAGFILSFLSVAGIFYGLRLAEGIFIKKEKKPGILQKIKRAVQQSVLCTVTVQLFMLPFLLFYYYEVSWNGILLNLVVIPLMPVIFITGILGGVLSGISVYLSEFIMGSTYFLLRFYNDLCRFMNYNPFQKIILGRPNPFQMILYYAFLLSCLKLLWKMGRNETIREMKHPMKQREKTVLRRAKILLLSLFLILDVLVLLTGTKTSFMRILDVGTGSCRVVRLKNQAEYVIDCGSGTEKQVGKKHLIPFLKYHAVRSLEGVMITKDSEEKMSGIPELFAEKEIRIEKIVLPKVYENEKRRTKLLKEVIKKADARGIEVVFIKDGYMLKEGKQRLYFSYNPLRKERIVKLTY